MIDLTEKQESQKAQATYVPEINEIAFTKKDNSSEVVKEMDLLRENGQARLYFGDTRLNTEPKESHNLIGTAWRATERGVVNVAGGAQKLWGMGESYFYQVFSDIESKGVYRDQMAWLNANLNAKTITQEEYDNGVKQAQEQLKYAVEWDMRQKDLETQKIKNLYEKVNLWNARVTKNFSRKEWEEKGLPSYVADMFESAPTSVTALAAMLMTKSPAVAAAVYGATAAPVEIADIAETEINAGASARDSLGTATLTSLPVMALDFASLKFIKSLWAAPFNKYVTKSKVFNAVQDFAFKNRASRSIWNTFTTALKVGGVSAAEETATEAAQGAIESNLPRVIGYGPEFNNFYEEIMDYAYQGIVGGGMGFLMGGVGSAVALHSVRKHIVEVAQKTRKDGGFNLTKEKAEELADHVAPVIVAHAEGYSSNLKKEIDNMDISEENAKKIAKVLADGFTPKDNSEMLKLIENSLDSQYPQGKGNANTIVARMLYIQAAQMAEAEGSSIEEAVNKQRIRVVNDPQSLNITDRFYNARNKKGEVVGAASKNVTDNIIYLLNTATPDVLVHETTHIFLNTISAMLRSGKVNARFSAMIGNVLDFIGAPEGENYEFSEAQQEKLAVTFQEISKTGVSPTAELEESFQQLSRMVAGAYAAARENKLLTPEAKKLFSDFFASRKADTSLKVTAEDVSRLKEVVQKILKGERVAVKDYKIIKDLLRFGQGYAPTFVGYSVADFIKEHPEYNQLDSKGKLKMLAEAGFEIASEQGLFANAEETINEIESKSQMVFLKSDTESQQRRIEIARYKDLEKVYKEVFDNNRLIAEATAEAINLLQKQGYVVTDKESMKKLSKDLANVKAGVASLVKALEKSKARLEAQKEKAKERIAIAKEKISQTQKEKFSEKLQAEQEKAEKAKAKAKAKEIAKNVLKYTSNVLSIMADTGVDVDSLENEWLDISENLNTMSADEITTRTNNLFKQVETFSNQLLSQYYQSDTFIEQEGLTPPVVKRNELKAAIGSIYAKQIPNKNQPMDYRLFEVKLAKALRKAKVPERYANLILSELRKVNTLTSATIDEVIDNIVDKLNVKYHKMIAEKYDARLSELKAKARNKALYTTDNIAVNYIAGIISKLEDSVKSRKGEDRKTIAERMQSIEDVMNTVDFNNDVIGKDETGKDVTLNPEQKAVANAFISQKIAELSKNYSYPNESLIDGYKAISEFSETSQSKVEQLLAERQQKFEAAVQKAYLAVSGRKTLPKIIQKLDTSLFARWLGGLRSNLIAVFGEDFANEYDVLVEYRKAGIRAREIKDRVEQRMTKKETESDVALSDSSFVKEYVARLELDKPYEKSTDRIGQLLKDYTRAQILDLYMIWQNDKGKLWVERTFEKDAEEVMSRVEQGMSRLDKKYAAILMSELEAIYPELAQAYYQINGKPLGNQRYYWPLYTMIKGENKVVRDDLNTFNAAPVTRTKAGMTEERTGVSTDPEVNPTHVLKLDSPTDKFNRYINTALKFQYVIPKLNALSEVIFSQNQQSEALRKEIASLFGEELLNALRKDFQFNLGVMPYEELDAVGKIVHEVFNNYIASVLFKPLIIAKQAIGMINYSDGIPWLEFVPDLLEGLLLHPFKTWQTMMSLPSVRNRFVGDLPMALTQEKSFSTTWLPQILGLKGKTGGKITSLLNKAKTGSTYPTRLGDAMAVVFGGYAFMKARERQLMQNPDFKNLSKEEQQRILEDELIVQTEVTQQSGLGSTKGGLQRSEGGGTFETAAKRAAMVFSSANVQFARKLREGLYEYKNGNITKSDLAKRFLIYSLLNPWLYFAIGSLGTIRHMLQRMLNNDDRWKDELYLTVFRPILDNFFAMGGMMGEVPMGFADMFAEKAGQKTYGTTDINMTPFFLRDISKKMGKKRKDKEDWLDMFLSLAQAGTPVPLEVSKKMIKSMVNTLGGEEPAINFLIMIGYSERQAKLIVKG